MCVSLCKCVCAYARDEWDQMSLKVTFNRTCVTKNTSNVVAVTCYDYLRHLSSFPAVVDLFCRQICEAVAFCLRPFIIKHDQYEQVSKKVMFL